MPSVILSSGIMLPLPSSIFPSPILSFMPSVILSPGVMLSLPPEPSVILSSVILSLGVDVSCMAGLSLSIEPQAAVPTARAATRREADTAVRMRMGSP